REGLLGATDDLPKATANDGSGREMFYAKPEIVRIDPTYTTAEKVTLKIVGHDFVDLATSTLVIGDQPYGSPGFGAANSYSILSPGSILQVSNVPRAKVFPRASVDFISMDGNLTLDANKSFDDSGPVVLSSCAGTIEEIKDPTAGAGGAAPAAG